MKTVNFSTAGVPGEVTGQSEAADRIEAIEQIGREVLGYEVLLSLQYLGGRDVFQVTFLNNDEAQTASPVYVVTVD